MPFILDIFNNDAFSVTELTDRINRIPEQPGRLGQLGIFQAQPVRTTSVAVEDRNGKLVLVPTTPRGGVGNQWSPNKRNMRNLNVPHIELNDTIPAEEVQNVRSFGSADALQGVQEVVDERMGEMSASLDVTLEYHRMGAVKGIIMDADGVTPIYNLFTEFNFVQTAEDFLLGTANEEIILHCHVVNRAATAALGGTPYNYLHALCGSTFFDKLITADTVKDAYRYFQATNQTIQPLREDLRAGFRYGNILFEEYAPTVSGVPFVATADAAAFPVGAPGLFKTYYAPGDFIEAVNTNGLPKYAKVIPDPSGLDKHVGVHVQTNPLCVCLRPEALIRFTTST